MKVILLKDVPKVGRQFDVKVVADGYALNFLFPKRFAELATKERLATIAARQGEIDATRARNAVSLADTIKKLDGAHIVMPVGKANAQGNLYKKIDAKDIARHLSKEIEQTVTEDAIVLDEPIRTTGERPITISMGGAEATFSLIIEAA
ncbi:MAG: 50S ribosomal protein L9 [Patescibacteria group bacterium]